MSILTIKSETKKEDGEFCRIHTLLVDGNEVDKIYVSIPAMKGTHDEPLADETIQSASNYDEFNAQGWEESLKKSFRTGLIAWEDAMEKEEENV
jgi:hypothetical protein